MNLRIRAGKRILYKQGNSNWLIGDIAHGTAEVNELGLYIPVVPKGKTPEEEIDFVEIDQTYIDAEPLDVRYKEYSDLFMTKEDYIKLIEGDEEFRAAVEHAYVSDGEYIYYRLTKFNRQYIEKQPFDYVVRYNC